MKPAPIMLMAGGTGGHVFPALAVAERLRGDGWEVVWLGTHAGLEARVVPAAGIEVEWISVAGLRGKGLRTWLLAPMHLAAALWQALAAMRRRRPAVVLGMGGYVSGPGGVAARLLGRPLLIHEQNSVAGLTNRVLARAARRVLTGFPGVLERGEWIGNPVRAAIAELPTPSARMLGRDGPLRVLVLGGSQGASALNAVVPHAVAALQPGERPDIRHQCGPQHVVDARATWASAGVAVEPMPFIDDMAAAYAWADLVVCRAGALTVSELAAAGVASVLVPFPAAVDDHQTSNARFLSDAGAAVLLPQHELNSDRLAQILRAYASDRGRLLEMAEAARALARPRATADLAGACVHAAEGRA